MKVVVTGYGSSGDTQPLLALADGLRRAGHQVVLVTDVGAQESAARLGLEFRILTGSARAVISEGTHGWGKAVSSGRPTPRMITELVRFNTRDWIETLADAAADADVIVASTLTIYHAASVAQERQIPLVFTQLQPSVPTRDFPPPTSGVTSLPRWLNLPLSSAMMWVGDLSFRRGINQVRRELGQPKLRLAWNEVPILMAWSPTLLPAASDWTSPDLTITGSWHLPDDAEWQPPTELAAFLADGDPPVYVGFGSMAGLPNVAAFRDALLEGLSGRRVLLSAGWAGLTETDLPDDVHPIGWVPHDWLFPRCAAVVHHCGAGTANQAARSGVPSIPVPFTLDQPFWAGRLRALGIATAPLDPRRPDAGAARAAVAEATSPAMTQNAERLARQIAGEPDGVDTAITIIERIAAA